MDEAYAVSASAFWLGILTSVSPCPLAANVAAMSYVGREVGSPRRTLAGGLLYTLGRVLAYAVLAAILVGGLLSVPQVALFLQAHMSRVLGPLLVAVGLVLLEWVRLPGFGSRLYDRTGRRLLKAGQPQDRGDLGLGAARLPGREPARQAAHREREDEGGARARHRRRLHLRGLRPAHRPPEGAREDEQWGYVETGEDMSTEVPGVYVAGDIRSKRFRQITTAVADGTIAALAVQKFLKDHRQAA